jgi:predicted transcriptional regulator
MPDYISAQTLKQQVHKLIDQLPDTATWDDVVYRGTLHRSIEKGLALADAGLLIPVEELLREYAL